jgi:conjugative transfer signal peptidase TraF
MRSTVQTATPFFVMGLSAVLISIGVLAFKEWGPQILINGTPSEPVGFYRLVRHHELHDYHRGMYVVFPVPHDLKPLVYGRHWLKDGVPFLKELSGIEGDQICVLHHRLTINGKDAGPVFQVDSHGLALPQHPGCFQVPPGDFFAASQYFDKSFDGRYFGSLPLRLLSGEARPVWIF